MRRPVILAAVGAIVLVGGAVAVTVLALDRQPAPLAPKQIWESLAGAEAAYKHGDFPPRSPNTNVWPRPATRSRDIAWG